MKEIFPLDKKIPFFIREHCGPRLASVFRHIASYDDRDSSVYPTKGIYVKTTNELVGSMKLDCEIHSSNIIIIISIFSRRSKEYCFPKN